MMCEEIITKNFPVLTKDADIRRVASMMVDKGIFKENEIHDIFSTDDDRHNARIFLFSIPKKGQQAYIALVDSLVECNRKDLADILEHKRPGCTVIKTPIYPNTTTEDISHKISRPIHVNPNTAPLKIEVKYSENFHDSYRHGTGFEYYYSRSKDRGRVLIINNYEFGASRRPTRNGASVDNDNLQNLFSQMGGWDVQLHSNKTAEEMKVLLTTFSQDKKNKKFDICIVIMMSHGNIDHKNETIIYGIDDRPVLVSEVERQFNNENCRWFVAKPKILLFQMCRGVDLDIGKLHYTETDSRSEPMPAYVEPTVRNIRTQDDMLIGHSTLLGYKAHRDPFRGSWYIEVLCEMFMRFAHSTPVDDLLGLVDQGLRKRMSEKHSMQTAEYSNKGFKKLYLHPGIFYENGAINSYFNPI